MQSTKKIDHSTNKNKKKTRQLRIFVIKINQNPFFFVFFEFDNILKPQKQNNNKNYTVQYINIHFVHTPDSNFVDLYLWVLVVDLVCRSIFHSSYVLKIVN